MGSAGSARAGTPALITAVVGILVAMLAAFVPLSEIAKLVNIGTLFAFLLVNIGVIILRRTNPDIGAASACRSYLMTKLEGVTSVRFGIWLAVGLLIYFAYGRAHSRLRGADIRTDTLPETP